MGAVAAVVLLVWVSTADLERSSQAAGVIGSVAGIAALGVGLWQLRVGAASSPEPVQAEAGSNAARGNVRNSQARDTAPGAGTSPNGGPGIRATGGSNAAGGDIDGATARHGQ